MHTYARRALQPATALLSTLSVLSLATVLPTYLPIHPLALHLPSAVCPTAPLTPPLIPLPMCVVLYSRPTRRSRSRRSWARNSDRTDPSHNGYDYVPTTLSSQPTQPHYTLHRSTLPACQSPHMPSGILCSHCSRARAALLSVRAHRYNSKRRHWRRTKLGI